MAILAQVVFVAEMMDEGKHVPKENYVFSFEIYEYVSGVDFNFYYSMIEQQKGKK